MEENIKTAETIIHKWNIDRHSHSKFVSIFHENNKEAKVFIDCVKRLHRAMLFLVSHDSKSDKLTVAHRLMEIAMKRLQKEFHFILTDNHQHLEPELVATCSSRSSPSIIGTEEQRKPHVSLPAAEQPSVIAIAISNLRLTADAMISCGYGKECIGVYKSVRKSTIDEALFHLGIQPYTQSHIKTITNASHFDNHIKTWLNAIQITVKTLFNGEKFLCHHVFASHAAIRDLCFEKSMKEAALNLFMFPELLATRCNKLKSDTVFVLIDLYNSISDLWPEIESIFSNESVLTVKIQALSSLHKLSNSIRTFIDNLQSFIQRNSSKLTVSRGGIHPQKLKEYVSGYQLVSWNKVILCLPENAMVSSEKVRDCFRRLCSTFEKVYGKQTSSIVVDEKMRDKMKASIANKLVPAYGEFYVKHLMTLSEDERCMRMLTRLSPEIMAKYLSWLFPGTSTVLRSSRSPHASRIVNITRFLYLLVMQENIVTC